MATTVAERYPTCDEFDALPNPDDGRKMELVDGKVVYSMTVGRDHGTLAIAIGAWLFNFAWPRRLGDLSAEVGFRLRESPVRRGRVRGPDVAFVRASRLPPSAETRGGSLRLAPDLAVEVISPDDDESERAAKVAQYLEAGTPRVWVVRGTQSTVAVHRAHGTVQVMGLGATLSSDDASFDVEGFALPLADLFATID